jgi:PAS domain-containing protein
VVRRKQSCSERSFARAGTPCGRKAARNRQSLLHFVVETLPNAVAVVDTEGRVVAANKAFRARTVAGGVSDYTDLNHLGVDLTPAVRAAAEATSSVAIRTLDDSGNRFDCRRLNGEGSLVALIAQRSR